MSHYSTTTGNLDALNYHAGNESLSPLDHVMMMEEGEADDETPNADILADIPLNALGVLLRFLIPAAGSAARWRTATKRLVCLAHAAGLDGIGDRSLSSIAKELGCTRAALSHHAIVISDQLHENMVRGGKSRAAREVYSKTATAYHRRAGHNMSEP